MYDTLVSPIKLQHREQPLKSDTVHHDKFIHPADGTHDQLNIINSITTCISSYHILYLYILRTILNPESTMYM